jgi:hypothetical protein
LPAAGKSSLSTSTPDRLDLALKLGAIHAFQAGLVNIPEEVKT